MKQKQKKKLKIYIASTKDWEWAILVFAHTAREAKKVAFSFGELEYFDIRINRVWDSPWLYQEMKRDEPHYIESPRECKLCEKWGDKLLYSKESTGICSDCLNVKKMEKKNE